MTFAWTPENVETLKAGVLEGKSASIIGAELGITRNAVLGKCFRMKMHVMRKPAVKRDGVTIRRRAKVKLTPNRLRSMKYPEIVDVFIPQEAMIIPLHINLLDLKHDSCRMPYGDNPRRVTFCGHITLFGSSYCAAHHINTHRPFVRKRSAA